MRVVPIVGIHDALLGFKNVAIVPNNAVGVRGFTNSCRYLLQHPDDDNISVSDLSLYHVGNFNLDTGDIEKLDPEKIASGLAISCEEKLNLDNVEFSDDPYEI